MFGEQPAEEGSPQGGVEEGSRRHRHSWLAGDASADSALE